MSNKFASFYRRSHIDQQDFDFGILHLVKQNDLKRLERLVGDERNYNKTFLYAVIYQQNDVVSMLLNRTETCCATLMDVFCLYACRESQIGIAKEILLNEEIKPDSVWINYARNRPEILELLLCDSRIDTISGNFALLNSFPVIRLRFATICFGLQDLGLPALVTLEILDALIPNSIPMYLKWNLIVLIKHVKEKNVLNNVFSPTYS